MAEKKLENKLKKEVEKRKGLCIKFFSMWFTGMPDRIVLLYGGRIWFVEVKDYGKTVAKGSRQGLVMRLLIKMGFKYRIVNSDESLKELTKEFDNEI